MYFRLIGWSSATRIFRRRGAPRPPEPVPVSLAGASQLGNCRMTVNTEPTPAWLLTWMSPPIIRARLREISRPRPAPPIRLRKELSAWKNRVNSRSTVSASMPTPVSRTVITTPSGMASERATSTMIDPSWVNLMALLIRLYMICRSRVASAITHSGRFAAA